MGQEYNEEVFPVHTSFIHPFILHAELVGASSHSGQKYGAENLLLWET
jgi:hypothetical protein